MLYSFKLISLFLGIFSILLFQGELIELVKADDNSDSYILQLLNSGLSVHGRGKRLAVAKQENDLIAKQ